VGHFDAALARQSLRGGGAFFPLLDRRHIHSTPREVVNATLAIESAFSGHRA
jgi:hypothetical protein